MRVTNGMITNNMLNSLNNNMTRLDTLYNQMVTLKKIQRPSDDPIITGRSLKLKVNVLEIKQYQSNADEATSWMGVTEKALKNTTKILNDIRTKCVQASTDTLGADDREKIKTDIKQLWKQLQQEANATYVGRQVFSGYKTDEPVTLASDTTLTKTAYANSEMTLLKGTEIPTGGITLSNGTILPAGLLTADTTLPITTITGDGVASLGSNKVTTGQITLPLGTDIPVGGMVLPDGTTLPAGLLGQDTVVPEGTTLPAGVILPAGKSITIGTVIPPGTKLMAGTMNPNVLGKIDDQNIQYEVGVESTITVNTLGMDGVMSKIFAAIKKINDGLDTYSNAEPDADLHVLFNQEISDFDDILSDVSEITADLGSRMKRLEYTESRLADDKVNFTELLSNTEDVDLEQIYTEFNAQYVVYQSALQATSKVIMNTLADFLR